MKQDCKKFARWKENKDKERAAKGEPPYQGKKKGVDSLDPEDEDSDYVSLGMCEADCDLTPNIQICVLPQEKSLARQAKMPARV